MQRVMIEPADYQSCRQAVDKAFSLFPTEVAGKKIMVKPNVLRAARPEEAVTTHPALLAAVVDYLVEHKAAQIVVGDNPGLHGYGANERCFSYCGLTDAAKGHYRNIGDDAVEVACDPEFGGRLSVSKAVMEADVFISLPKFKTHGLTVITGALKNSYGILPGAQKALFHKLSGDPARFSRFIVDVFCLRKPDLIIMDAILGMQGNGPASDELRYVGKILASDSAIALDACMARMMGLKPEQLPILLSAKDHGLGDFALESIECLGELLPIADYKTPSLGGDAILHASSIQALLEHRASLRPKVDEAVCDACGTCVDQCPANALHFVGAIPVVDATTCIACYCCQEMCPKKAITLQAPGA